MIFVYCICSKLISVHSDRKYFYISKHCLTWKLDLWMRQLFDVMKKWSVWQSSFPWNHTVSFWVRVKEVPVTYKFKIKLIAHGNTGIDSNIVFVENLLSSFWGAEPLLPSSRFYKGGFRNAPFYQWRILKRPCHGNSYLNWGPLSWMLPSAFCLFIRLWPIMDEWDNTVSFIFFMHKVQHSPAMGIWIESFISGIRKLAFKRLYAKNWKQYLHFLTSLYSVCGICFAPWTS